jgi:uncharacterized protein involved in exopolysaccharide biosynthesis
MASVTTDFDRTAETEPEISLLDLLRVLGRRKRIIAGAGLIAAGLTAVAAFLWPPTYTAEAVILPPQPEQSSQAMMMGSFAGLGNLGGLAGLGAASALLRNPAELYIGILKSRTVAESLIAKFRLPDVYGKGSLTGTRKALERHTTITAGRDSLIRIRVDDRDRTRAAELANAYVDELQSRNSGLALTSASQRRLFFERQLAEEKNALADAEVALKKAQQGSGLVFPQGQSEALIRSIAQLRAEIAGREVQLQSMRAYAAPGNPQLQMVERETTAFREQLDKLERGAPEGLAVPARKLPEASLDYVRKLREVKYHELLFEILSRQYEAARIDEVRMAPLVQVVDAAVVPDRKSWPPRTLFTVAAGCLGALGACVVVLVRQRPAGAHR